ncbi:hypothetical protein QC762_504170 [Podospora pseudocomata]|uniref:SH3 domain-containing protein n=1 Tax=Podospora pseudocomata TaxID=2093779 RepID=A0ABR0GBK1_9PEZI|nr:hypothetical protein QC762_504170 [Podospora pseudocomata]
MDQREKALFLASPRDMEEAAQHADSTQPQQQHRRGLRSTVRILGATTCLLVFLLHILLQVPLTTTSTTLQPHHHHASKPPRSITHPTIKKRIPGEHVVLADCRDRKNVVSSQMAYYVGDPGPIPGDVAIVETPPGQTALWINTETSALFYNSNVTFTAWLGPKVGDGQFAGTGDNGYGNFTCWQRFKFDLYRYNNDTICSGVYACNHDAMPAVLPTPGAGSSPGAGAGAAPEAAPSGGLPQGAMIGIIVAVVGSVLFGIAMGVFWWYWRRTRQRQQQQQQQQGDESPEPKTENNEASLPPPTYASAVLPQSPAAAPKFELAPGTLYEMDGQWYRVEMATDTSRYEMDAQSVKKGDGVASGEVENEEGESPTSSAEGSNLSAMTRGDTVSSVNSPVLTPVNAEGRVVSPPVAGMPVPVLVPIPGPGADDNAESEAYVKTGSG